MKTKKLTIDLLKNPDLDFHRGQVCSKIVVKNWTRLSPEDLKYFLTTILKPMVVTSQGTIVLK